MARRQVGALMFDSKRALPSAVFLAPDGNLLTGQRAW
jgi:hypothetical protein